MDRIIKIIIILCVCLCSVETTHAYITIPSTTYTLEVGNDKYLAVPTAYYGYIDHAVWTCTKSEIVFKEKDAAGAIIQISKAFSGSAIVEVLATERYLDRYDKTRALTYYKQYIITCIGGTFIQESEIIIPDQITLSLGETKHYKILSSDCYNGAFSLSWRSQSPKNFAFYTVNWNTGDIDFSGSMVGEGILTVKTVAGDEKDCKIMVEANDVISDRRTEKKAVSDIKYLISNILPISEASGIQDIIVDDVKSERSKNLYNIRGILIKRNASIEDLKNLPAGLYIYNGQKFLIH